MNRIETWRNHQTAPMRQPNLDHRGRCQTGPDRLRCGRHLDFQEPHGCLCGCLRTSRGRSICGHLCLALIDYAELLPPGIKARSPDSALTTKRRYALSTSCLLTDQLAPVRSSPLSHCAHAKSLPLKNSHYKIGFRDRSRYTGCGKTRSGRSPGFIRREAGVSTPA